MRQLPIHPADRWAAFGQAVAVLLLAGWCCWTTYLAAPRLVPALPGAGRPLLGVLAGFVAMLVVLAGLVFARVAGAQDARRAIQEHREAQARNRAERGHQEVPARYPATVGGRHRLPADRWSESNGQAAIAGRRVLDNAAAHRFELPAGLGDSAG